MTNLLIVLTTLVIVSQAQQHIRACYYSNWAQYRAFPATFLPENIEPLLCDHFFYAFADMNGNSLVPLEWNDDDHDEVRGMYRRFNEHIKLYNPIAKTLLTVGGWSFDLQKMTSMLATAENRTDFVTSSLVYLRERDFDGLDLNFQYPGSRGSPSTDKQRYTLLVEQFREVFQAEANVTGREMLLLTSTVSANRQIIDAAYEIDRISENLDFINVMAYDLHGAWEPYSGHHSPLYSRPDLEGTPDEELTQDWAANYWFLGGAPKNKLVIGMAMYGRCQNLSNPDDTGMGAPCNSGCPPGPYVREAGLLSYFELCNVVSQGGNATRVYDEDHQVPYAYMETSWIGYDDVESLTNKVNVLLMDPENERGSYAGWMSWNLDLDDFTGTHCDNGKYPLHTALNEAVGIFLP